MSISTESSNITTNR